MKADKEARANLRIRIAGTTKAKALDILNQGTLRLLFNTLILLLFAGLAEFPQAILEVTTLESLNLSQNAFTSVPEKISALYMLRELNLGSNQLSTLPQSIDDLLFLKKLDLTDNSITCLPDSISSLSRLQTLLLTSNKLGMLTSFRILINFRVIFNTNNLQIAFR